MLSSLVSFMQAVERSSPRSWLKESVPCSRKQKKVNALTDANIIAAGDVFKVVGSDKGYLIVTGGTVASNEQAITFTPALDKAIADNAVVTFQADHDASLAFHKNAFALVSAPLEPPLGGARAGVANYKGLACRVVYDYTMSTKTNQMSLDSSAVLRR